MKTISVVRHAKSSWEDLNIDDKHRTITHEGFTRTMKLAHYLKNLNFNVQKIISSPATRTLETARILIDNHISTILETDKHLYPTTVDSVADCIFTQPDDIDSIIIVGHNAGLSDFTKIYLADEVDWLKTSMLVWVEFDCDNWIDFPNASKTVKLILNPKNLE